MRRSKTLIALFAVIALIAAACGGDDEGGGEDEVLICEVTDVGGVDDKGFNASAWAGAQRAAADFGGEAKVLESQAETDYEVNLNSFVDQDCDIIVTVGFLLGDATQTAANANPDSKFTIVDFAYGNNDDGSPQITNANVKGLVFNTDEAAFLAGYVAAGTTATGTVGTFGGINIPPVTIFMDGFVRGVRHYNSVKGTSVNVLGWDPDTAEGSFTNNFESLDDGRAFAQNLVDEGADIVMPVAGPVGLGSAALASELGNVYIVGVDVDGYEADANNSSVYLTSVLKRIDNAVYAAADETINGTFSDELYVGQLSNEGVGLAPYHDLAGMVPSDLQAEVEALRADIISGAVDVKS
ncbi:MAG: BMP family ABC transporter substrate-binding protein [Acidimicrobiia bacterium]|nr:BMP family ABC transporter substrate-binding protein [Acidimicrobiia bacterium]MBT8193787.1 BMP family ABC transporter substrate-binding protein [Acidimicrobiia bacterium]MBT8246241.1 BMP family ABC transporter substrate-binding protein [Acidimicrobiia bacterium]NNF88950.1 BMP family ABC transporter substrate-binding protein [Acidimicrobiia bacterium]NNJ48490.1 BMP family ABC transporter substrate-binding protein [Acidimicrobiia bacterium]